MTKADLAFYAKGIHNDDPEARFTMKQGADELTVEVIHGSVLLFARAQSGRRTV